MNISEAFLVNTKNFDAIVETLASLEKPVPTIDTGLLEKMGFSDPNDLLVIRILKEFDIISNDGDPDELFTEFSNPKTTRVALAKGLVNAYESLFERSPSIHKKPLEKVREEFQNIFQDKKTDLIIKYISGTFVKIVSYCGTSVIDDILGQQLTTETVAGNERSENAFNSEQINTNGTHPGESPENSAEDSSFFEEVGSNNVDDIINNFDDAEKSKEDVDSVFFEGKSDEIDDTGRTEEDELVNKAIENEQNRNAESGGNTKGDDSNAGAEKNEAAGEEDRVEEEPDDFEFDFDLLNEAPDMETDIETEADTHSNKTDANKETGSAATEKSADKPEPAELEIAAELDSLEEENLQTASSDNSGKGSELIRQATLRKAELLFKLQRWEDLLPALNDVIGKYEDSDDPALDNAVSKSVIRRATALLKLKRSDEVIPALEAVIDRLQDSEVEEFYNQASMAMLYKTQLLEKKGVGNLLPLYNKVISRLDGSGDPSVREKIDSIHLKRFDIIIEKGSQEDVLKASTELVNRFRNATDSHSPEYLKVAMIKRAEILEKMGRNEEALKAYDEFLSAFN